MAVPLMSERAFWIVALLVWSATVIGLAVVLSLPVETWLN